jgi:hypothetical protein
MVLHLEGIAFHVTGDAQAWPRFVGEGANVEDRLPGLDEFEKTDLCSTRLSVCSTSTGLPATPLIGCRTTKPVRFVGNSVSLLPSAEKVIPPSAVISILAA